MGRQGQFLPSASSHGSLHFVLGDLGQLPNLSVPPSPCQYREDGEGAWLTGQLLRSQGTWDVAHSYCPQCLANIFVVCNVVILLCVSWPLLSKGANSLWYFNAH